MNHALESYPGELDALRSLPKILTIADSSPCKKCLAKKGKNEWPLMLVARRGAGYGYSFKHACYSIYDHSSEHELVKRWNEENP